MRGRTLVYVDAGYLLASAATRVAGTSLRGSIDVDHARLMDALAAHATSRSGLPLLRVHWYDAARNGVPDPSQEQISLLPRVKLRLGRIGVEGDQKGVDLRIGLDLVTHARNQAVSAIYLVSGDDDLSEAVEAAQEHGVAVTILAVPTAGGEPHGVSRHLHAAADELDLLEPEPLDHAVTPRALKPTETPARSRPSRPTPAVLATPAAAPRTPPEEPGAGIVCSSTSDAGTTIASGYETEEELIEFCDRVAGRVLTTWLRGRSDERHAELTTSRPSIPGEVDKALLLDLSSALGIDDLSDRVRHQLRTRFWLQVDRCNPA